MRCKKCGAQINLTDKFCPTCGAKNEYLEGAENLNSDEYFSGNSNYNTTTVKPESPIIGILALVFSILGGCLGLIFAVIGLVMYKEKSNRNLCIISLLILLGWILILLLLACMGVGISSN